ncbi:MAG: hypothetical protein ACRDTJ_15495 [Pseudonocardiaceae bacterium]
MFGEAYDAVSRLGIEALKTLTAGVRGTADGLAAMARNTQQTDQDNATEFGTMGAAL